MDYQSILEEIKLEVTPLLKQGKVADYIPALAKVDRRQFAMSLTLMDGTQYNVGQSETLFSIQSISKLFTFALALQFYDKALNTSVGREPSGNPFNSLVQLEYEQGVPRNPFINAGAINISDTLVNHYGSYQSMLVEVIEFIRAVADNQTIHYNKKVAKSEMAHSHRNLALAHLMKSFGNFDNDVREVVQVYFKHCAVEMNTQMLSRAMLFLANQGTDPVTGITYLTPRQTQRINAVMLTCGHYDASGEFAYQVGLPGKSGVGGGIVAVVPKQMGITVWSPGLDPQGNSLVGTKALELFVAKTGISIL